MKYEPEHWEWCERCLIRTEWKIRNGQWVCAGWRCKGNGSSREFSERDIWDFQCNEPNFTSATD